MTRTALIMGLIGALAGPARADDFARGVAGRVSFEYGGAALRAIQNQTLASPILVRIAGVEKLAGTARYTIEFIGALAGGHDLRAYLEHEDGTAATDLPPIPVTIYSQLPPGHGSDVFGMQTPDLSLFGWYRAALGAVGAAWIVTPAVVFGVKRLRRRPAPAPVETIPPPTLAEQLRPLIESAIRRTLSTADRGRLELLLYSFWRERLGLGDRRATEGIGAIRRHGEAGVLLHAVERWLHAAPGARRPSDAEIHALLGPYRNAPAAPEQGGAA